MITKILVGIGIWFVINALLLAIVNAHPKSEEERRYEDECQEAYLREWNRTHRSAVK